MHIAERYINLSERCVLRENERLKNEVGKIFPGVNLDEKFLLVVNADFYLPFSDKITGEIAFRAVDRKDGEVFRTDVFPSETRPVKIRTPYWNKQIYKISSIKGRSACNIGTPMIFDSFEEMSLLNEVIITWKFSKVIMTVKYNISFERIEGLNKYFIYSKDMILESLYVNREPDEHSDKITSDYINEFDFVFRKNSNQSEDILFARDENRAVADFMDAWSDNNAVSEPNAVAYCMIADEILKPYPAFAFPSTKNE